MPGILIDMIMPKKEGLETIMALKREFPEVNVIAISGGWRIGPEPYLQVAEGLGAVRLFEKPFKLDNIVKAVRELLHN